MPVFDKEVWARIKLSTYRFLKRVKPDNQYLRQRHPRQISRFYEKITIVFVLTSSPVKIWINKKPKPNQI